MPKEVSSKKQERIIGKPKVNKNLIHCDEATLSKDISRNTDIVTGVNSGVGLETTRQLIKQGAHVVMACRQLDVADGVANSFEGLQGNMCMSRVVR